MSAGGLPTGWMRAGREPRLLVVVDRLLPGGVSSRYATLLAEAVRRGHRCLVIAADGPARHAFEAGGCQVVRPAGWGRDAHVAVAAAAARADHAVCVLAPDTAPVLAALVRTRHLVVGAHGTAELLGEWIAPALLDIARAALAQRPDAGVVVPGRHMERGVAGLLAIDPDRVRGLPHAVTRREVEPAGPPRSVVPDIVLCATRLTEEQRPLTRAAVALATERGAPLLVVGTGPDSAGHRALAEASDPPGRVVEDPAVRPWMRRASVLVGRGLVVLEAIAEGCRAVCIDAAGEGVPVRAVGAGDWRRLADENFVSDDTPPGAAAIWRTLHRQTPAARRELAATVLREAGPGPALDRLLDTGGALPGDGRPEPEAAALAALLGELRTATADASAWLTQLTRARDHHRDRAERAERLLGPDG